MIDALIECGQIRYIWNVHRGYRIVWLGAFEMVEQTKASVELQQAQARDLKTKWSTIDEIRAEEGKDPLPDKAGEVILENQNNTSSKMFYIKL